MQLISQNSKPSLPREKIFLHGADRLSSEELLMVILGNGNRGASVRTLARQILEKLPQKQLSLHELRQISGIGLARACQVLALREFVERLRPQNAPVIDSLNLVLDAVAEIRTAEREMVYGLYLDTRLQLQRRELLAVGSVNEASVKIRDIFAVIKHQPISHLILVHNHPSGVAKPSAEDIALTKRLEEACDLLGLTLLDHVIVSRRGHFSFKAAGYLSAEVSEEHQSSSLPAASTSKS